MKKNIKFLIASFIAFMSVTFINGQSVPGILPTNSFEELNIKRNELTNQLEQLKNKISKLNYDYNDDDTVRIIYLISANDERLKIAQDRLVELKKTNDITLKDSITQAQNAINYFKGEESALNNKLMQAQTQSRLKDNLSKQQEEAKKNLIETEYKINQLMIPKISQQNFMFWASIFFVVLMGIILFTFFFVVRQDPIVRLAIFGSDSGLQFVTLFSIIIAIILFGLTGILEGKELSALLGSIAGYILGKVKFTGTDNSEKPKPEPATSVDSITPADLKKGARNDLVIKGKRLNAQGLSIKISDQEIKDIIATSDTIKFKYTVADVVMIGTKLSLIIKDESNKEIFKEQLTVVE